MSTDEDGCRLGLLDVGMTIRQINTQISGYGYRYLTMSGKVEIEYAWNRDRIETEMYESRNKNMEGT